MTAERDTIAAISTAPGRGGIGVVRLSGPHAASIATRLLGTLPSPRTATLRTFRDADGQTLDHGLVLHLPGPGTYTGEDTVELHGHGAPVVLELVLAAAVAAGARRARPGEYTERAFLNGRLDLAQAEAVADLIASASGAAARAAMRTLRGEFSREIAEIVADLVAARAQVEAAIDFADEGIDPLADAALAAELERLGTALGRTLETARRGRVLGEGFTVALAGRPNAGKSSLLNRLARESLAIVTEVPGTTRDVIRESLDIGGLPVRVLDTAGLHEARDPVETIGVARARDAHASADLVLVIVDATDQSTSSGEPELPAGLPEDVDRLVVMNKTDLVDRPCTEVGAGTEPLWVSAITGGGVAALEEAIRRRAGLEGDLDHLCSTRARHVEALVAAGGHVEAARTRLGKTDGYAELAAEDLRLAQAALGEITGSITTEDLLGAIFSTFCVGK